MGSLNSAQDFRAYYVNFTQQVWLCRRCRSLIETRRRRLPHGQLAQLATEGFLMSRSDCTD
jgi:hypothetical protein